MIIRWNEEKNQWLRENRNINFEKIADMIRKEEYVSIGINENRNNQPYYILEIDGYFWACPFVYLYIAEDPSLNLS